MTTPSENLKIVILLRPPKAMIGVSQEGKDPHLVSMEMLNLKMNLERVLAEVPAIVEIARARFAAAPQHPAYNRPAPAPRPAPAARTPTTRAAPKPKPGARPAKAADGPVATPSMFQ
jgi:hypothetical protein